MRGKSLLLLAGGALLLIRCTTSGLTGGTTDTGNARIGAVIYTADGGRAAGVAVTVCPAEYVPEVENPSESAALIRTVTDDTGYFHVDTIDEGDYSIEVNDGISQAVRLQVELSEANEDPLILDDTLQAYATVDGHAGAVGNTSIKRYCLVYGLDRRIPVAADGSFRIDDLPSGTYNFTVVADDSSFAPVSFDSVTVIPDSTVSVETAPADTVDTAQVTINTSPEGADIERDLYGFPLLVRLTEENFDFGATRGDGSAVRFVKTDGSDLAFQVEQWDSAAAKAVLWVRVDTVFGNDDDQNFLMLWGTGDLQPADEAGNVFDSSNGCLAGYHLAGSLDDATPNGYNGANIGSVDTGAGIIGRARWFNGSSHYFTVGDLPDRDAGTISFWFRPHGTFNSSTSGSQGIWGKYISDRTDYSISLRASEFYTGLETNHYGTLIAKLEELDSGYYVSSATASFAGGAWYFAAWSWGPDGDSLYINGSLQASLPHSVPVTGEAPEEIGRCNYDTQNIPNGGYRYFKGTLDEFRIDNTCRSPEWVKLGYMNQRADDRVVTIRAVE